MPTGREPSNEEISGYLGGKSAINPADSQFRDPDRVSSEDAAFKPTERDKAVLKPDGKPIDESRALVAETQVMGATKQSMSAVQAESMLAQLSDRGLPLDETPAGRTF